MIERKAPCISGKFRQEDALESTKPGVELETQKPNADYIEFFSFSSFLAYFDAIKKVLSQHVHLSLKMSVMLRSHVIHASVEM